MNKIDLIIDALSVAQNSVWSALNQEALAAARELRALKPVAWMYKGNFHDFDPSEWASPEFVVTPLYTAPPRKEWVGLSINEGRDFFESKLTRAELITEINEFLEEKNT